MRVSSALRVLGLDPRQGFDLDLVNRAYRIKSLQLHPDKNPDKPDANAQFQKLTEAIEVLRAEVAAQELRELSDQFDEDDTYLTPLEKAQRAARARDAARYQEKMKDLERRRRRHEEKLRASNERDGFFNHDWEEDARRWDAAASEKAAEEQRSDARDNHIHENSGWGYHERRWDVPEESEFDEEEQSDRGVRLEDDVDNQSFDPTWGGASNNNTWGNTWSNTHNQAWDNAENNTWSNGWEDPDPETSWGANGSEPEFCPAPRPKPSQALGKCMSVLKRQYVNFKEELDYRLSNLKMSTISKDKADELRKNFEASYAESCSFLEFDFQEQIGDLALDPSAGNPDLWIGFQIFSPDHRFPRSPADCVHERPWDVEKGARDCEECSHPCRRCHMVCSLCGIRTCLSCSLDLRYFRHPAEDEESQTI